MKLEDVVKNAPGGVRGNREESAETPIAGLAKQEMDRNALS
jgi:hypothetical protein